MDDALRPMAERYAGGSITDSEWREAIPQAERKLEWIIQREGDAGGERRKPYYIAQLIAEAVRAARLSLYTRILHELNEEKEAPLAVARGTSQKQPHYSMV